MTILLFHSMAELASAFSMAEPAFVYFKWRCPGFVVVVVFFFRRVRYVGRYVLPYPYLILLIIPRTDGSEFFKSTEPTGM